MTDHQNCCCASCVASRRALLLANHPLLRKRAEEPEATLLPTDQVLAMKKEERDELRERLAAVEVDIRVLQDCAEVGRR